MKKTKIKRIYYDCKYNNGRKRLFSFPYFYFALFVLTVCSLLAPFKTPLSVESNEHLAFSCGDNIPDFVVCRTDDLYDSVCHDDTITASVATNDDKMVFNATTPYGTGDTKQNEVIQASVIGNGEQIPSFSWNSFFEKPSTQVLFDETKRPLYDNAFIDCFREYYYILPKMESNPRYDDDEWIFYRRNHLKVTATFVTSGNPMYLLLIFLFCVIVS